MSKGLKKCDIEAPGHNLPAKLRPGKLRRSKLAKARLENRGDSFIFHEACMPLPGCDSSYIQNMLLLGISERASRRKICYCTDEYATHDSAELARALEGSKRGELYEVHTKNLGGLLIYMPNVKRYFWLQTSPVFFLANDCQKTTREEQHYSSNTWFQNNDSVGDQDLKEWTN